MSYISKLVNEADRGDLITEVEFRMVKRYKELQNNKHTYQEWKKL